MPILVITEVLKRIVFMVIYPISYVFRKWVRMGVRNVVRHILWLALDDSINKEGLEVYGKDIEYCAYGKRSGLVEKLPEGWFKEFARSYHWGALRNNAINLTWELTPGDMVSVRSRWGKGLCNFYELRNYPGNWVLPYLQFYVYGDLRFKIGFLTNGRFELQLRTKTRPA